MNSAGVLEFLKSNKIHVFYVVVILAVIGGGYSLFVTHPREKVVTKIVTEVVTKVVTKVKVQRVQVHDNIVTNRKKVTTKPDGTVVTEEDNITNKSVISRFSLDKEKEKNSSISQLSEITKTTFAPKYTLSMLYLLPTVDLLNPTFQYQNVMFVGGVRLGNSPLLINVGTDTMFKTGILGITMEL